LQSKQFISKFVLVATAMLVLSSHAQAENVIALPTDRDSLQARVDILRDPKLREFAFTTFDLTNDQLGSIFMSLLVNAANRGVKVQGIIDNDLYHRTPELLEVLRSSGVELRFYHPINLIPQSIPDFLDPVTAISRMDHRLHDKLFIAKFSDGRMSMINGDKNYRDMFFNKTGLLAPKALGLLGREIYIEGPLVVGVRQYFDYLWRLPDMHVRHVGQAWQPGVVRERARLAGYFDWIEKYVVGDDWKNKPNRAGRFDNVSEIRFVHDDFDESGKRTNTTLQKILKIMSAAPEGSDIYIENAYFVLHPELEAAIKSARLRGAKITVLTNSPVSTDEKLVADALMLDLPKLKKLGINLYFTRTPNAMHSKLMKINDTLIITSANLDPRSLRINSESGVIVVDHDLASFYGDLFKKNLKSSIPVLVGGRVIPFDSSSGPVPDFLRLDRPVRQALEKVAIALIRSEL
jgi:putative cardiolipin synthase